MEQKELLYSFEALFNVYSIWHMKTVLRIELKIISTYKLRRLEKWMEIVSSARQTKSHFNFDFAEKTFKMREKKKGKEN